MTCMILCMTNNDAAASSVDMAFVAGVRGIVEYVLLSSIMVADSSWSVGPAA